MALTQLTKVDGRGINTTSDYRVGILTAVKFVGPFDGTGGNFAGVVTATDGVFSGNVTIGGTLTYEDVTNIDSVGIITAQKDIHVGAGVSAVGVGTFGGGIFIDDSITHIGDPNTKIRFPTDDNISFEAGATGEVARFLPTSAGSGGPRMGLGTNNPTGMLHIYGVNPPFRIQNSNDSANLQIGMWDASHIMLQASNRTFKFATETTNHMVFHTGGLAGSYERLRITSGGTVNIGGNYSHTGSKFQVTGNSTFTGNIDANGDIDVDGHTNLDNVSIAGVTTITNSGGLADFKAIELEKSGTSGASRINFLENGTIRGSLTYSHDNNRVELISENGESIRFQDKGNNQFGLINSSGLTLNGDLDVDGHTNLDNVSIAGFTTVTQDLDVDGHTNLDNVSISGIATALRLDVKNGSDESHFAVNQIQFNPTGHSYIDNATNNKDIYIRLSRSSAMDTTMMQFDSDGEIIKFYKQVSVGLQGGGDTAVLGGGSGIGAQLTLKYADGTFNTRLLGNGDSYLNVNHGNLGVGIAAATKKLHVYKSNNHPVMLERGDSNNTIIELKTNGATRGFWGCSTTANFLVYDNDTSDINLAVNQNGNVDIAGEVSTAQDYPNFRPTLDFNFAATKKLDPRISFYRTKIGSYIDENGDYRWASPNEPKFNHDEITHESKGLLIEPERTNKLTNGNNIDYGTNSGGSPGPSLDANNVEAPDGSFTATRIDYSNASGNMNSANSEYSWGDSAPAGKTYSASIWVKGTQGHTINFYLDASGQGSSDTGKVHTTLTGKWQRISVYHTYPSGANAAVLRVGTRSLHGLTQGTATVVSLWGTTVVEESRPGSTIATPLADTTTAADYALIDGEDFTEFFNQVEGTIISSTDSLDPAAVQYPLVIEGDNTSNERHILAEAGAYQYQIKDGGSTVAQIDAGSVNITKNIIAAAYKLNDTAVTINGSDPVADTSATMPTCTKLKLGHWSSTNYFGHISRFMYYRNKVSNSQLKTLSSQ